MNDHVNGTMAGILNNVMPKENALPSVPSNALFGVLWGFQCPTCRIRSGHAYIGTYAEAVEQAPTCCGFVAMTPVRIDVTPNTVI